MFSKFIAAVVIGFLAMSAALAQAPPEGTRVRVAGTVDKLDARASAHGTSNRTG